jgi:hypothetical protein
MTSRTGTVKPTLVLDNDLWRGDGARHVIEVYRAVSNRPSRSPIGQVYNVFVSDKLVANITRTGRSSYRVINASGRVSCERFLGNLEEAVWKSAVQQEDFAEQDAAHAEIMRLANGGSSDTDIGDLLQQAVELLDEAASLAEDRQSNIGSMRMEKVVSLLHLTAALRDELRDPDPYTDHDTGMLTP